MFRLLLALLACTRLLSFVLSAAELECEMIFAVHGGAAPEDVAIRHAQERAAAVDASVDDYERLGWCFVAKGRRTLDAGFYTLAEATAKVMSRAFGDVAAAGLLRGHALHQLHRFSEAEVEARKLVATRGAAEDFGLLSDVLMEQGKIADAVQALQRMVDLKPGAEALSRIAHLRWLTGDVPGAIRAMEDAHRAVRPRETEKIAWLLMRLSTLYLHAGDVGLAARYGEASRGKLPDYAPALFALARANWARGYKSEAVPLLQRAVELSPFPEYQWWLADALRGVGNDDGAEAVERELKRRGEAVDPRTLAMFLATRGEAGETALRLAQAELADRRDVFTRDAHAWALAATGDLCAAAEEIAVALAQGTQDARLLYHASEIAFARGELQQAARYLEAAMTGAATLTPSERAKLNSRYDQICSASSLELAAADRTFVPQRSTNP